MGVRIIRTARRSRIIGRDEAFRNLVTNPAFLGHLATDPVADPLFFLSHQHYLARGLSADQRIVSAQMHYDHEVRAFDEEYLNDVYQNGGLVLWSEIFRGIKYEIRIQPGNDVLYEGGISVIFFVDGGRVCVLSYSVVPASVLVPGAGSDPVLFLTRKQLTQNRAYQADFNRAFDRCMPGHLCMGAVVGIAAGLGHDKIFGITPERQPAWSSDRQDQFETTYAGFWESLGARRASALSYVIDLPLHMTPLDEMDAGRRRRARQRRAHIAAVEDSALAVISDRLRVSR